MKPPAQERCWPPPASASRVHVVPETWKRGPSSLDSIESTPVDDGTDRWADTMRSDRPPEMRDASREDEESATLDRDTAETGPCPIEVAPAPLGPWRDDESSIRDDRPRSSAPADSPIVRRGRARPRKPADTGSSPSFAGMPSSAVPSSSTYEFPDHSSASGAMWPDDEDQAVLSVREIRAPKPVSIRPEIRVEVPPSGTTLPSRASFIPPPPPPPRVAPRARHPFSFTGELPIASSDCD